MDKSLKQIKPMTCPVCGKLYFSKLSDVEIKQLGMTPNTTQCHLCGWFYDLEQVNNPDLEHESNEMSLNQYKMWYQEKIKENPDWEYYEDFIGEPEPHLCSVCGEYEFEDDLCYDICPVCGWQDNGMETDPYDKDGGPSDMFLKHKQSFLEKRQKNPNYNWLRGEPKD